MGKLFKGFHFQTYSKLSFESQFFDCAFGILQPQPPQTPNGHMHSNMNAYTAERL